MNKETIRLLKEGGYLKYEVFQYLSEEDRELFLHLGSERFREKLAEYIEDYIKDIVKQIREGKADEFIKERLSISAD